MHLMGSFMNNKEEYEKNNQIFSRFPLLFGILLIACVLVGSTVVIFRFAEKQEDEAVYSLTEFYLEELAERRTSVITANLNSRKLQMEAAVEGITEEDLEDKTSLREYLSFIQKFNSLDMFAMVDEDGMVYTDTSTYAGISRFGFLSEEINETIITVNQAYVNKNMVIIATPVEGVVFKGKNITACFSGINMNSILNSISLQTSENQTFCNIIFDDGTFLTKAELGNIDIQDDNILDYLDENVQFDEGYSLDDIKHNMEQKKAGFTSFMNIGQHDYFYYRPIEGTDWYFTIFINENIIDHQLESVGNNFMTASMVQIIFIIIAMFGVFLIIYRFQKSNEKIRYEKLKSEEISKAKQEEAEEKLKLQTRLLAEEKEKHRYDEMFRVLSEEYHLIYYVNIEENRVVLYRINESIQQMFHLEEGRELPFDQTYRDYVMKSVVEEEREEMLHICEPERIRQLLVDNRMFTHLFRVEREGNIYYRQLRMAREKGFNILFSDLQMWIRRPERNRRREERWKMLYLRLRRQIKQKPYF